MGNFEWNPYSVQLLLLLTMAALSLVLVLSSFSLFHTHTQILSLSSSVRCDWKPKFIGYVLPLSVAILHIHTPNLHLYTSSFSQIGQIYSGSTGKNAHILCWNNKTKIKFASQSNAPNTSTQSVNGFLQSYYYCCCWCIWMCFILISDAMICRAWIFHTLWNNLASVLRKSTNPRNVFFLERVDYNNNGHVFLYIFANSHNSRFAGQWIVATSTK